MSALFIVGFGGSGLAMTKPPAGAPTSCGTPERICSLVDALRGHDLRRGFATFWNANIGMLAAHDDVTIGSISFPPAIHPLRWLASERSFAPVAKGERFFVAIAKKDRATIDEARLSSDLGQPAEIVHAADFEIRVYVADQRNTAWLSREGF